MGGNHGRGLAGAAATPPQPTHAESCARGTSTAPAMKLYADTSGDSPLRMVSLRVVPRGRKPKRNPAPAIVGHGAERTMCRLDPFKRDSCLSSLSWFLGHVPQLTAEGLMAIVHQTMRTPLFGQAGWPIALVAVLAAGCAPSRFQNDPRAAGVGPYYLEVMDHPRDRATQYYYPEFRVAGMTNQPEPSLGAPNPELAKVQRLLTVIPPTPPSVQAIQGQGWPELERQGMPVFLPPQRPAWNGWGSSWTW